MKNTEKADFEKWLKKYKPYELKGSSKFLTELANEFATDFAEKEAIEFMKFRNEQDIFSMLDYGKTPEDLYQKFKEQNQK